MACTCKPGKPICISCLVSTQQTNFQRRTTGDILVNANGEYTLNQIDIFEKQFKNTIVPSADTNPLSALAAKYPDFYDTVNAFNNDFFNRDYVKNELAKKVNTVDDEGNATGSEFKYPVLVKRLTYGAISPLEYSAFFKDSNYTPSSAIISGNANGPRFLNELEDFFNGDFSVSILGGFCGLFNNIFAAIDGFFNLIGTIGGLITDALSLIKKIKNIKDDALAFFESIKVKALIEAIKKKITDSIEKAIDKVKKMIENFSVENIIAKIDTYIQKNIVAKIEDIKNDIKQFFSEENIKKITDKIKGLIDYGVGCFDNPSLEEIQFLIARICSLATGLEGLIKGLKAPLDDFSNRYDEVFNTLKNVSNRVTGEAIRAGAIRYSEPKLEQEINKAKEVWVAAGNIAEPAVEEFKDIPSWDDLKSGSDPRIKIRGRWTTAMKPPSEGWTKLDADLKVYLMRLQKEAKEKRLISNHLYINSGFRSQYYNDLLISEGVQASKNSLHMSGTAVDISWDGYDAWDDKAQGFIALARKAGFRGVGRYDTFIHLDIGPVKDWDNRTKRSEVIQPTNINPTPVSWNVPEKVEDGKMTREQARRIAMDTKSDVTFEEGGRTFKASYKPPTASNRAGKDINGSTIETVYKGSVAITLVR